MNFFQLYQRPSKKLYFSRFHVFGQNLFLVLFGIPIPNIFPSNLIYLLEDIACEIKRSFDSWKDDFYFFIFSCFQPWTARLNLSTEREKKLFRAFLKFSSQLSSWIVTCLKFLPLSRLFGFEMNDQLSRFSLLAWIAVRAVGLERLWRFHKKVSFKTNLKAISFCCTHLWQRFLQLSSFFGAWAFVQNALDVII